MCNTVHLFGVTAKCDSHSRDRLIPAEPGVDASILTAWYPFQIPQQLLRRVCWWKSSMHSVIRCHKHPSCKIVHSCSCFAVGDGGACIDCELVWLYMVTLTLPYNISDSYVVHCEVLEVSWLDVVMRSMWWVVVAHALCVCWSQKKYNTITLTTSSAWTRHALPKIIIVVVNTMCVACVSYYEPAHKFIEGVVHFAWLLHRKPHMCHSQNIQGHVCCM